MKRMLAKNVYYSVDHLIIGDEMFLIFKINIDMLFIQYFRLVNLYSSTQLKKLCINAMLKVS